MAELATLGINIGAVLPSLVLVIAALTVMAVDMFSPMDEDETRSLVPWITLSGIFLAGIAAAWLWQQPVYSFQGMATSDHFALTVSFIILSAAGMGVLLSANIIPLETTQVGEYYILLLLATSGMLMMGASTDLITVFVALEIFSLALYILSGIHRRSLRSTEASIKYFMLGAFSSAFFVYGAALVYGAAGATQYDLIVQSLATGQGSIYLLFFGIALMVVGFGFKISLAPFHMWTPDVYQGAPTPVAAFMSAATKTAGFAALIRILLVALPDYHSTWSWALAILAVITMTWGNLAALKQLSLKRMLAYSSVAHAGYVLVALTSGTAEGANAALFYLFTYAFMNMGAFAIVLALEEVGADDALQNRAAGISDKWPLLAFAMAIFMFSLAGVPPLAGFFGKFLVFKSAVDGGWTWLAVIGMLNSAIAAYYYLRVVVAMYFETSSENTAEARRTWSALRIGLAVAAAFTILIGIFPSIWTNLFTVNFGG